MDETIKIVLSGLDRFNLVPGPVGCVVGGVEHQASITAIDGHGFIVIIENLWYDHRHKCITPDLFASAQFFGQIRDVHLDGTWQHRVKSGIGEYFDRLAKRDNALVRENMIRRLNTVIQGMQVSVRQLELGLYDQDNCDDK